MVAIGDSYVWGNGLRSADKFRTLVQQQLSQSLQRPVRSVVYAHSDATLKPDSSLTNAPRPGDVGGSYPTIEQQADCVPNPANVDFILMDGCINDLPAFNIADPTAPPESIAKQVASKCLPMAEVLAKILARFPKARVVLVGYHLLYSEQTPADLLPSVYRHLDVSAISPLLAIAISLGVQVVRDRVAQNSWTFYTESNRSHAAAVAAANAADPHRPASGRPRASFVPVPVRAQNAYGAPDTYLWLIPVPPTTDDMYPARVPMCDQAFPRDFAHNAVCRENS